MYRTVENEGNGDRRTAATGHIDWVALRLGRNESDAGGKVLPSINPIVVG